MARIGRRTQIIKPEKFVGGGITFQKDVNETGFRIASDDWPPKGPGVYPGSTDSPIGERGPYGSVPGYVENPQLPKTSGGGIDWDAWANHVAGYFMGGIGNVGGEKGLGLREEIPESTPWVPPPPGSGQPWENYGEPPLVTHDMDAGADAKFGKPPVFHYEGPSGEDAKEDAKEDVKDVSEGTQDTQDTQQQGLGFVDAQKAAGWQYYEDMRRRDIPGYQAQVNPFTGSLDSGAVPNIPQETYDPALLESGNWDQLQNMAFIVREAAALGDAGAMANYGWSEEDIRYAEWQLDNYSKDYPNFSGGTGDPTTTAGSEASGNINLNNSGGTGQPNASRTSTAAGDVIANWAPDVYGHTERDIGASYVKEGGGAVDGWWIPYVPAELNPDSIFLAISNAMLPYLSQTDRQLMGNQMNVFNNEVFANYNAIPKAVMGSESWDDYFNGDRWRNMHLTLKALETSLTAKAGGDQALIGSGLMPLRWLIRGIESLQMYVGDNITRLNKEMFQRMYDSLLANAAGQGAAGLDQVFALLVNPYVPGLDSFWNQSGNVSIL